MNTFRTTFLLLIFSVLANFCARAGEKSGPGKPERLSSPDQVPQGLAPSDWKSIRAAYEAGRHAVRPVEGKQDSWFAVNPGQQWRTSFDSEGFLTTPTNALEPWSWGLALQSYGWMEGELKSMAGKAAVTTEEGRIVYKWDSIFSEWFVNDRRGLEHGFTIAERPAGGREGQPLTFVLSVRGTLRADVIEGGQNVAFRDEKGAAVLDYAGLKVWDADGKMLTSRFELADNQVLRLRVDERGARYPLMIDPLASRQAYLKASNTGAGDGFGASVSVSGNTVVIGAPDEDSNATGINGNGSDDSSGQSGAAYVFVLDGTTWSQQAYLKASNTGSNDAFGESVAISGNTVVIGAPNEDSNATGISGNQTNNSSANSGAAYVFTRSSGNWSQQAYLKASNTGSSDWFGSAVAIDGDTAIVTAPGEDSSATGINGNQVNNNTVQSGAAYVFVRSGTTWTQQAYVKASNTGVDDNFGISVAFDDNTLVVGAEAEDSSSTGVNGPNNNNSTDSGAAYVFVRNGTAWSQQAYLKASNTYTHDNFGISVGIDGDIIAVGAEGEDGDATEVNGADNNNCTEAGAAYVFVRNGTTWSQQAYLKASNTGTFDNFGHAVSVSADTVVVGADGEDSNTTGVNGDGSNNSSSASGAAYVFVRSGAEWSQQAFLKTTNTGASDGFGVAVVISGDIIIAGAPDEDSNATGFNGNESDNSASGSGAAYVFVRSYGNWSACQQAYVKASNTDEDDVFGMSVSVSGNTVVVGAPFESSSVVGGQNDNSLYASGAVYVFTRSAGVWTQQAFVKSSNASLNHMFGYSVAISGNTMAVGCPGEATAYIYVYDGGWNEQACLSTVNSSLGDFFGCAIAISGDTVIVGAYLEDSAATGINGNGSDNSKTDSGAAYIFERDVSGIWSQKAYLKAFNTDSEDRFGLSVSISGDTAIVGAAWESSSAQGVDPGAGAEADNSATGSGAAYIFSRNGTGWHREAYLKASNTGAGDGFGYSVAISRNTIVVGAYGEDSSSIGVGGNEVDNSKSNSGAAYVFVKDSPNWTQQAYLKASNADSNDQFGGAVAISGNTAVVGASQEASNAKGVNGNENDNSSFGTGAVYVFLRNGSTWTQQAYLKASNPDSGDFFGGAVAISHNTVVVKSPYEDSSSVGINPGASAESDNSSEMSGAAYIFSGLGAPYRLQLVFDNIVVAYPDSGFSQTLNCVVDFPQDQPTYTFSNPSPFFNSIDLGGNWRIKILEIDLVNERITKFFFEYHIPGVAAAWFWIRPPHDGSGADGDSDGGIYGDSDGIPIYGEILYPKSEGQFPAMGSQTLHIRTSDFSPSEFYYDEGPQFDTVYGPYDFGPDTQRTSSGEVRLELAP